MPEVAVVNSEGVEVEKLNLSSEVFGIQPNMAVMHQAVVTHLAAVRQGTADTRTRAEVAGGAAKPRRQKGTGRSRQGTIRAAQWEGGGIVFGPHPRDYTMQMPKKMRRLAIKSALASKLGDGHIKVVDDIKLENISTKVLVGILEKIGAEGKTTLVIGAADENLKKSGRNIPWLTTRIAPAIGTYEVLNSDTIIFTKDALAKMEEAHGQ